MAHIPPIKMARKKYSVNNKTKNLVNMIYPIFRCIFISVQYVYDRLTHPVLSSGKQVLEKKLGPIFELPFVVQLFEARFCDPRYGSDTNILLLFGP